MVDPNLGWAVGAGLTIVLWGAYVVGVPIREKNEEEEDGGNGTKRDFWMTRLWEGADGRASFSKFQFWLWTYVILLGLVAIWMARWFEAGEIPSPINEIPDTLLGILGVSTATSLGAKAITTAYVNKKLTKKPTMKKHRRSNASSTPSSSDERATVDNSKRFEELLTDDGGYPELAKLQMLLFTLVTMIFFLATVGDRISSGDADMMVLPDIDRSLLILMGISATGYIGKKAVTQDRPTITAVMPSEVVANKETPIMLTGRSLGTWEDGVLSIGDQLFKDDRKDIEEWSDSIISLKFTGKLLKGEDRRPYRVELVVGDTESTHQTLWVVKGEEPEAPSKESGEAKESGKPEGDSD